MSEAYAYSTIPAKILLPIDFSPSSHLALEQATVLAQHFHAEVILVNVVPEDANIESAKKVAEEHFKVSLGRPCLQGHQGNLQRRGWDRHRRWHPGRD